MSHDGKMRERRRKTCAQSRVAVGPRYRPSCIDYVLDMSDFDISASWCDPIHNRGLRDALLKLVRTQVTAVTTELYAVGIPNSALLIISTAVPCTE